MDRLIEPTQLNKLVAQWIHEDIPSFEPSSVAIGCCAAEAVIYAKTPNTLLAGAPFVSQIFKTLDCRVSWMINEGESIPKLMVIARIAGPVDRLLQGERLALNLLTRLSSIATFTKRAVQLAQDAGWKGNISGTRKTTPGFRILEKYALLIGGADIHRMDLSSMIMLKDNHVHWIRSQNIPLTLAIKELKAITGFSLKVEVETSSLSGALEAAQAGADVIMLDHVSPCHPDGVPSLQNICQEVKRSHPCVLLEASGGIRPDPQSLPCYFIPELDLISMGCLTQDAPMVDFSLKLDISNAEN